MRSKRRGVFNDFLSNRTTNESLKSFKSTAHWYNADRLNMDTSRSDTKKIIYKQKNACPPISCPMT